MTSVMTIAVSDNEAAAIAEEAAATRSTVKKTLLREIRFLRQKVYNTRARKARSRKFIFCK